MSIVAFAASHRPNSLNVALLTHALSLLEQNGLRCTSHDYAALELEGFNHATFEQAGFSERTRAVHQIFSDADGLLIASPEYNWSYAGTLKNIIDWMSCFSPNPFEGKTVCLLCATPSENGGLIGLQHLKNTLGGWLGAYVYPVSYGLGMAHQRMSDGKITDASKQKRLEQVIQGFSAFHKAHYPVNAV
jgi:chromate reductase, NAD(P)H dehydrogenase (quinone)